MQMFDQKKAIDTIMQKRGSKGGPVISGPAPMKDEKVLEEPGVVDGRHLAAQDALAAFHEGSADKLAMALANFHDLHAAKMSEPADDDGDDD